MTAGAIQIANDGRCCKVTSRRQGLVTLAATNVPQFLTTDKSIYFQKLWLYPASALAGGLLTVNAQQIFVGDNGQKYAAGTVTTLAVEPLLANANDAQPLTAVATATAHGFASGDTVTIIGAFDGAFNGTWAVTKIDANHFSYSLNSVPVNANGTGAATTYAGWQNVTSLAAPDLLNPTDLPLKYELPLGQSQPLASILMLGTSGDGLYYRLWA